MSPPCLLDDVAPKGAVNLSPKLSPRKLVVWVALGLGTVVLAVAVFLVVFGGLLVNGYGKEKVERAFAQAHPGCGLRIGELFYAVTANRLTATSVTLSASNTTFQVARISLTGVRWTRLLWGTASPVVMLAQARLEATNLTVEFPLAHYRLRCARLRASLPTADLIAAGIELRPRSGDEEFFAAHVFRTPRFHLFVPECRVLGLAYGELFEGQAYRAGSVDFSRPSLEVLLNRDQPVNPLREPPLMVQEALAAIGQPLRIDHLSVSNGFLSYCERLAVGAAPGILTFGAVNISVDGLANRSADSDAIRLRAQGEFMHAGLLKVLMTIPVAAPDFSFRYSGSLEAMDLTRLNAFLETAEHTRLKSGRGQEATFDIVVTAGQARGRVRAIYRDLEIAVLDPQTGTEKGWGRRVTSFLAKVWKIRASNLPDASGSMKEGEVNHTKTPDDEFLQFAWLALRSGLLDIISR